MKTFNSAIFLMTILPAMAMSSEPTVFKPFDQRAYQHVNAFEFSPDGETLYLALFTERVKKEQGVEYEGDPEVMIYAAKLDKSGNWSAPQAVSFAGVNHDYEPTIAPDGSYMLFNSWRPMPDGRPIENNKNNIWISHKTSDDQWGEPVILEGVSKFETEESYPAISQSGRIWYGQEILDDEGTTTAYHIYMGQLDGSRLVDVTPFAPAATDAGEGDPWVAADGSLVVFTRWDFAGDWNTTADLYVTFKNGDSWTEPVAFPYNSPEGPDFSASASADGKTFYWKQPGGVKQVSMQQLLDVLHSNS